MLNEYQKRISGLDPEELKELEISPWGVLAKAIIHSSSEAGAAYHDAGGLYSAYGVVGHLLRGDVVKAREEVDNLRQEVRGGEKGTGKDALTRLQGLGIIEELFEGDVRIPTGEELGNIHANLWKRYMSARVLYERAQDE